MQRLEVSGAVRPLCGSLCVKGLTAATFVLNVCMCVDKNVRMMYVPVYKLHLHVPVI